jgi:hypothetical protein
MLAGAEFKFSSENGNENGSKKDDVCKMEGIGSFLTSFSNHFLNSIFEKVTKK